MSPDRNVPGRLDMRQAVDRDLRKGGQRQLDWPRFLQCRAGRKAAVRVGLHAAFRAINHARGGLKALGSMGRQIARFRGD